MFSRKRECAPGKLPKAATPMERLPRIQTASGDERGAAIVELALTLPILLLIVTGIFSIGQLLDQNMQLTDAVNVAGKAIAIARGLTTDPCNLVYVAATSSSGFLAGSNSGTSGWTFTTNINGNIYTGTSCSSSNSQTGAAGDLTNSQGQPVSITITYPCSITIYGQALVPSCTLSSSITEIVQ